MKPSVHIQGAIRAGSTSENLDLWVPPWPKATDVPHEPMAEYPVDTDLARIRVRVFGVRVTLTLRFAGTVSVYIA